MADKASRSAQHVASTAMDQGQQVARSGVEQARQVVDTSRQQAAQVAQELSDQARGLLDDSMAQLQDQAETQIQRLAQAIHRLGDEAQALADGRPQEARTLRDYADKAAAKLEQLADDLESKGTEGLLDDVQTFARTHPGSFFLGAGVAGLAVGRLLRNAATGERQPSPEELPPAVASPAGGPPSRRRRTGSPRA